MLVALLRAIFGDRIDLVRERDRLRARVQTLETERADVREKYKAAAENHIRRRTAQLQEDLARAKRLHAEETELLRHQLDTAAQCFDRLSKANAYEAIAFKSQMQESPIAGRVGT